MTEQYKCPSYYDDDGVLQDCTCGKCGSKADWLRSEIKKIVLPIPPDVLIPDESPIKHALREGEYHALTSIITRYEEELLELNEPPIKASKNSCVDCGISVEPYEAQCSDCRRQV